MSDNLNWGSRTDPFGLVAIAAALTPAVTLKLKDPDSVPAAQAMAEQTDENGDIVAHVHYGAPSTLKDVSCTYELVSGTLDLSELELGELNSGTGLILASLGPGTSSDGWPTIAASGRIGCEAVAAPTGKLNTYHLPAISLVAAKRAQPAAFGLTLGEGCVCKEVSAEFSIDIAETTDGLGVPCAHGVSGGKGTLNATVGRVTAAPSATLTLEAVAGEHSAWGQEQPMSLSEPVAGWHEGAITASMAIYRKASA
jgi:hypothetical protein